MREEIERYKEFVRPYYVTRDVAHTFKHIERIINRLDMFSEGMSPPPRKDRLYFLACFHGLATSLRYDKDFRDKTTSFLRTLGWKEEEIPELFQSLERHVESPVTVEEQIVHDANRVEILGAFGIAKAFTIGGIMAYSYEKTANHFEQLVLHKTVFRTPVGKRISNEGKAYAKEFLERLRREL